MPCVFFSGGIDSVVLAYDVASFPHRYGVDPAYTSLFLIHVGNPPRGSKQRKDLDALVRDIRSKSRFDVQIKYKPDGLQCFPGEKQAPLGGPESLSPILSRAPKDLAVISYTPGWSLWMAAVAMNELSQFPHQTGAANPEQGFIGHQWNAPVWRAIDEGQKLPYDCLPEFFEHANRAMKACNERVVLRTPFLENRMDRLMIVQLGVDLGVPFERTSSCSLGWKKECGLCSQCILRLSAFKTVGLLPDGRRSKKRG